MKVIDDLNEKQKEALSAVQRLNNELHDKFGWDNPLLPMFSITISGFYTSIDLMIGVQTIRLYNSEQDERLYFEISDKYETFYSFLKRGFREYKANLNKFKL